MAEEGKKEKKKKVKEKAKLYENGNRTDLPTNLRKLTFPSLKEVASSKIQQQHKDSVTTEELKAFKKVEKAQRKADDLQAKLAQAEDKDAVIALLESLGIQTEPNPALEAGLERGRPPSERKSVTNSTDSSMGRNISTRQKCINAGKVMCKFMLVLFMLMVGTIPAGLCIYAVEKDDQATKEATAVKLLADFAQVNMTASLRSQISDYLPNPQTDFPFQEVWPFTTFESNVRNMQSIFYAWTTFTTIGYGSMVPTTDAAKLLTILWSIPGIALFGFILTELAKVISRGSALLVWLMYTQVEGEGDSGLRMVFNRFDADDSGTLNLSELGNFVSTLQEEGLLANFSLSEYIQMTEELDLVDEHDDASAGMPVSDNLRQSHGHISTNAQIAFEPFVKWVRTKGISGSSARQKRFRVWVEVFMLIGITFAGCSVMKLYETEWTWIDALYFCWITTTTIGLGDYVPTHVGSIFALYLYAAFTLGAVANLIGSVGDLKISTSCGFQLPSCCGYEIGCQAFQECSCDPDDIVGVCFSVCEESKDESSVEVKMEDASDLGGGAVENTPPGAVSGTVS